MGGLIGGFFNIYGVQDSYAQSTVSGTSNVGGIVGYIVAGAPITAFDNVYWTNYSSSDPNRCVGSSGSHDTAECEARSS